METWKKEASGNTANTATGLPPWNFQAHRKTHGPDDMAVQAKG